jgi:hypothetical protein
MKIQGIISNGGASFTLASIAAFFVADPKNAIQPLMHYFVDGDEYLAKPNTNGAYTSATGAKYELVKSSDYAKVKVGASEYQFNRANNTLEVEGAATGVSGVTATLGTNGKVILGFTTSDAVLGTVLTSDGVGGFTMSGVKAYTGLATNSTTTAVDANGVITSNLNVDTTAAANRLQVTASGVKVLIGQISVSSEITNTYNPSTGAMVGTLNVSTQADNRLQVLSGGVFVKPYTVGANSQQYMTIDQTTGEIDFTQKAIIKQRTVSAAEIAASVGGTANGETIAGGTVAAWLFDNKATTQEGDFLQFPSESLAFARTSVEDGTVALMYEQYKTPNLTQATGRSWFSAQNGVSYNSTTGVSEGVVAAGNSGLTVGPDGFNFNYVAQTAYDESGVMNGGTWLQTNLHALITATAVQAKKMFDTTATSYFLRGTMSNGVDRVLRFYVDEDGAPATEIYTGTGNYSTAVGNAPF